MLGIVGLIVTLVAVGFFLPGSARVERSRVVRAEPEALMDAVSDLRRWPDWSPWIEQDPRVAWSYSGPQQGVGATQRWSGPKAGRGRLTITRVNTRSIEYDIWFDDNPVASPGGVTLEATPKGTRVSWFFTAQFGANPLARWFGLLVEPTVGPDFERGLKKLDALVSPAENVSR